MSQTATIRYRITITIAAGLVLVLGLLSRSPQLVLPAFMRAYAGDTLWALLVYLLIRWLRPAQPLYRSALAAGLVALGIEISQLYHAPWIDTLRHTRIGGLVLGFGFLWRDLLSYACGIVLGCVCERIVQRARSSRT